MNCNKTKSKCIYVFFLNGNVLFTVDIMERSNVKLPILLRANKQKHEIILECDLECETYKIQQTHVNRFVFVSTTVKKSFESKHI